MKAYWILAFVFVLTSCEKEILHEEARPVKVIAASKTLLSKREVEFPGTLRAFRRADLSFRVDGMVVMKDLNVGDKTEKGQVLLQLDQREYEIALKKAQGKVESIQAQLNFAERDYQRIQTIYDKDPGAISQSLLDRKKETGNELKADLVVAESELNKAQDELSYTVLRAPFDGIIAAIYVENHEQVHAKQTVLRFLDVEEREMEINIPEKYINALLEQKNKLSFEVYLDAFPNQVFQGIVNEIGTEASATTQTYPVTLILRNVPLEFSLLAGMTGKAVVKETAEKSGTVFKLPKSAIFTEDGKTVYVWVVDPQTQTVHKKAVKLEPRDKGNFALVNGGIAPGDLVVVAGTSFLNEGQKVKIAEGSFKP